MMAIRVDPDVVWVRTWFDYGGHADVRGVFVHRNDALTITIEKTGREVQMDWECTTDDGVDIEWFGTPHYARDRYKFPGVCSVTKREVQR